MADEDLHNPFISFAKEVKDGLVLHAKVPCFLWLDVNGLTCIDYETRQVTHNAPLESVTNVRQDGDKLRCHLTWDGAPKEKVFVVGKVVATAFYQRLGQLQAAAQDTEHLAKLRKEAIHVPIGASPAAKYLDGVEENAPSITRSANSASDKKEGLKALQIPSSTGRSITESPDFPFSPSRPETPDKQKVAKPKKKLVTRMGGADTNVAEMELLIEETETGREMREVMLIIHNEGLYVVKEGPGQKYSQRKVVYISYRDISKSRVVWNEDEFRVTVKKRAGTSVCYKFETPQGDVIQEAIEPHIQYAQGGGTPNTPHGPFPRMFESESEDLSEYQREDDEEEMEDTKREKMVARVRHLSHILALTMKHARAAKSEDQLIAEVKDLTEALKVFAEETSKGDAK